MYYLCACRSLWCSGDVALMFCSWVLTRLLCDRSQFFMAAKLSISVCVPFTMILLVSDFTMVSSSDCSGHRLPSSVALPYSIPLLRSKTARNALNHMSGGMLIYVACLVCNCRVLKVRAHCSMLHSSWSSRCPASGEDCVRPLCC